EAPCFVCDLWQVRKAHALETAGIGEDRPRPIHEAVQAAERRDAFGARTQYQVIGVGKHDVGAGCTHRLGREAFHRCLGADRQERRGSDCAVRRRDLTAARSAIGGKQAEREGFRHRCGGAALFPPWAALIPGPDRDHSAEALSKLPAACQASSNVSSPLSSCVGCGGQPRICRSTGTTPEAPPTTAELAEKKTPATAPSPAATTPLGSGVAL